MVVRIDSEIDAANIVNNEDRKKYIPHNAPFDPFRPVKAIVVGAGVSGIAAGIILPNKVRELEYVIYERNTTVGGVWASNIYPGVRCDIVGPVYQFGFEPNYNWPEYYPSGQAIREYSERIVAKHGVDKYLKLRHEVLEAQWQENRWHVKVKDLSSGEIFADSADFLISAAGVLSQPRLPLLPGLESFKGHFRHTAEWDPDFDPAGKRIAVVGNGASGVQLIPNLLALGAARIDNYVHSPVWVAPTLEAGTPVPDLDQPGGPKFTEEQQQRWIAHPEEYVEFRRKLEFCTHQRFEASIAGSQANDALRKLCVETMSSRIQDEELLKQLLPDYAPACRRITPAPGYLESIATKKINYTTQPILNITETSVITADEEREVDAIIAATGYDSRFSPKFPTIANGRNLQDEWSTLQGHVPETYFGVMAPGFPNYFLITQAQGVAHGGSIHANAEESVTYIAKCIRKIQSQSYVALSPSQEATEDFNAVVEGYFENKADGDTCNSWFKVGKGKTRVAAAWPGTGLHKWMIQRDPRWEDFEFIRDKAARTNRFEYFGNGWTERERRGDLSDVTRYVQGSDVDLATFHELWNE